MVDDVIEGFNGTVLAYGQTGTGKTYTVYGPLSYWRRAPVGLGVGGGVGRVAPHGGAGTRAAASVGALGRGDARGYADLRARRGADAAEWRAGCHRAE